MDHCIGEGSFFKAHVDTPRSENMFGSLVVFYPTAHEGGSFLMRKQDDQWSFDSAKVLADHEDPHLGYVALYSDVEHEVTPITSGYRVTATYNLYFDQRVHALPAPLSSMSTIDDFKIELSTLLIDPEFLPNGGHLGFGLEYAYPLSTSWRSLNNLKGCLKGVDADLMNVFRDPPLVTSFWSIIEYGDNMYGCKNYIPEFDEESFGQGGPEFSEWLVNDEEAFVLESGDATETDIKVNWVKNPVKARWQDNVFINYGNESYADHAYHNVCFIVEVGRPGNRGTSEPEPLRSMLADDEYYLRQE
jgi:hypothetical protein